MTGKLAILITLLLAHPAFGALQGFYPERELLPYMVTSAVLLVSWVALDRRLLIPQPSKLWLTAPAVFGFFAMPVYLAATHPSGSWKRWVPLGVLYFVLCVGLYGWAFTWVFQRSHA